MFQSDPRDGFVALNELLVNRKRAALVIPTNLQRRYSGAAVMGAGLARAAALRTPNLERDYGHAIANGRRTTLIGPYLLFPTKHHWKDESSLVLIEQSCDQLVTIVRNADIQRVLMPRVGCGLGRLNWHRDVRPLLVKHLAPIAQRLIILE